MSERENSLETSARWGRNAAIGVSLFYIFTLVIGTLVWPIACLCVRNQSPKRRKVLMRWNTYTDPAMGLAYACGGIAVLLALFSLLMLDQLVTDGLLMKTINHTFFSAYGG